MTVLDPLADLQPKLREAEKKARLLELADSILAARRRGVALTDIVKRLAKLKKSRIKVSADYLNEVMAEYHGEAWPKGKSRMRGAKLTGGSTGSLGFQPEGHPEGDVTGEATGDPTDNAAGQAAVTKHDSSTEPASGQAKDRGSDLNQHAGPRRARMRM